MPFSISVLLQYIYPQHLLSRLTGIFARCHWRWFKNWAIKRLIRVHQVDLTEIVSANLDDYPHFNSFFTRHLRPERRPIAMGMDDLASPVDGTISQIGTLSEKTIFQAKNFNYSLNSLLAGADQWVKSFQKGRFATLYLAPRDYHRVHMPCDGQLQQTIYVPGRLFSVNPLTVANVPNLFARNERLICLFDSQAGPMAVILVGAMLVGQMKTVWSETPCTKTISTWQPGASIFLKKGDEMGLFLMGSTVIVLFGQERISWAPTLKEASVLRFGQAIGSIHSTRSR